MMPTRQQWHYAAICATMFDTFFPLSLVFLLCVHKIILYWKMYAWRKWQGALLTRKKKSLFSGSDLMKSSQWYDNTIHPTTSWNEEKKSIFCWGKKCGKASAFHAMARKKIIFSYKNIFLFPLIVFGLSSLKCL